MRELADRVQVPAELIGLHSAQLGEVDEETLADELDRKKQLLVSDAARARATRLPAFCSSPLALPLSAHPLVAC